MHADLGFVRIPLSFPSSLTSLGDTSGRRSTPVIFHPATKRSMLFQGCALLSDVAFSLEMRKWAEYGLKLARQGTFEEGGGSNVCCCCVFFVGCEPARHGQTSPSPAVGHIAAADRSPAAAAAVEPRGGLPRRGAADVEGNEADDGTATYIVLDTLWALGQQKYISCSLLWASPTH